MSKLLKNTTASPVIVTDTGITIAASGNYTIPPQDYLIWGASSNVITFVGAGTLIVNDGSSDLTISDGIDWIKDIFPKKIGIQDGSNVAITSTTVGSSQGLDIAPNKYAPNTTLSGTLTALNTTVTMSTLDGYGTAGVVITGTWVGTISFYGSSDGTNYVAMSGMPHASGIASSTTTANGSWRLNLTGMKSIQIKMTSYTSGTASITVQATPHAGFIKSISTIAGGTDGTPIGNVGDSLKTYSIISVTTASANILRQAELSTITKSTTAGTGFDVTGSTYTVPTGKSFNLMTFGGSFDVQSPMYLRFQKQTAGTGSFATLFRISLKQQGQDESNFQVSLPLGLLVGTAGDVFKITYESALSKGTLWTGFTGVEF